MKKRIFTLVLALIMCLSLIPVAASADEGISVTVIDTKIKADTVANVEGYGSLVINEDYDTLMPPLYALIDGDGKLLFDYGEFPCRIAPYGGVFANGIVTEKYGNSSRGVYSLFDLTGKQVTNNTYDHLNFYNGYGLALKVRSGNDDVERFLIDSTGKKVLDLPEVFSLVLGNGEGDFMFENQSWDTSYYGGAGGYGEGLFWFYTGVNLKNNISEANKLNPNDISYEQREKLYYGGAFCGYMDATGKIVIPQTYNVSAPFSEGLAYVEGDLKTYEDEWYGELTYGKYGYIDKTGKTVIGFKYSDAGNFADGYAYVANENGKYGYIDKTGKVVVPLIYDSAFGAGNGLCSVGNIVGTKVNSWGGEVYDYKHGFVDTSGKVIVPLEYDDVSCFANGVAYGIKNGNLYIFKLNDTVTTPIAEVPSAWAAEEVAAAIKIGLVPENLQQNYAKAVSRGDVAEMIVNLLEKASNKTIDELLEEKDVEIDADAFTDTSDKSVLAANALGIINGTGDGKFSPNGTFTRAQIAAIINRIAGVMGYDTEGYTHEFTDVAGNWVDAELGWPVSNGIINGVGDNKFNPAGALTTEQAIAIMYRALPNLSVGTN